MRHTFTIPGRPQVKQRPRMTRSGRAYTPQATTEYERHVAESYGDGPLFTGLVRVAMKFYDDKAVVVIEDHTADRLSKLRGDGDNYEKAILDGLQWKDRRTGRPLAALRDDKQVVKSTWAR